MARPKDPFLWDVEEVISNICQPRSPWTLDPTLLATKIRDEEIDGRLLLTSEKTLSKEELMQCLGILKFRHKAALAEKLTRLQSESMLYRKWDQDFTRKQHMDDIDEAFDVEMENGLDVGTYGNGAVPPPNINTVAPRQSDALTLSRHIPARNSVHGLRGEVVVEPETTVVIRPEPPSETIVAENLAEPPSKKRRAALINTSAQPFTRKPEILNPWEHSKPWSYLGKGKITAADIKSSNTQISTRLVNLGDGGFAVVPPNCLPPGRRLAVSQVMKQIFRKNGRREALAREGVAPAASSDASSGDDEELDLAELSDWDEQTWQEILEEEEDNKRARELDRSLTPESVELAIEEAIEEMRKRWEERKLLKHERQAYRIWNTATRRGDKLQQILNARQQVSTYESRIKHLVNRIKSERWKDEREVKLQARCLEQTLEDKLHQLWRIRTLELRQPPPKPHLLPPPPSRKEKVQDMDPDDEVLTSTDDDDGFIVPDDLSMLTATPTTLIERYPLTTPIRDRSPMLVDLTQSSARHREKPRTVIDLTTPVKGGIQLSQSIPEVHDEGPPSLEDINVEEIAAVGRKHWAAENDRWRLAIYILRHLTHERRTAVLTRIMSSDDEELWGYCIEHYLKHPLSSPEELFDMEGRSERFDTTRAFHCFISCRYMSEDRFAPLKERHTRKLRSSKAMFSGFCNFVRNIVLLFPQDSQIMDIGHFDKMDIDAELSEMQVDGELSPVDDLTSSHSRNALKVKKQIVQNRDAMNLREREKVRGQEQEARRLKLRQTLATGAVAQDKSRLIINESKEEGQPLIYINDEIGKQIKDHQIEGVRFLWNQIIQDKDIRQGCLLAHTMGLGKTMQVITLLVAIAEASASPDPAIRSQIPEDLRFSRTLILCPSGLVENWMDEILKWAPYGLLGILRQLDSSINSNAVRKEVIEGWAKDGGVLITGYPMFQRALKIDDEVESILLEQAVMVVADEAHKLKNPDTGVSKACAKLTTISRIALTGSPLANNVEEYYAMINWVAPNFLGPIDEFRNIYARDIHAGCYRDSDAAHKRKALVRLQALKETVAPKVNRATVKSCLVNDLPAKSEFVIALTPTALQVELYNMYIDALGASSTEELEQGRVFSIVNDLGLICNHPSCFESKLQKVKGDTGTGKSTFYTAFPRNLIGPGLRVTTGLDKHEPSLSLKTEFLMIIFDEAYRVKDKVLVFSQSLKLLDYLEAVLRQQKRRLWRLDGQTKIQSRQDLTKAFNKDDIDIGLISTTAGGVGLNIQGANRVVIFDSRWNPVDVQQAVGRAYRIGQQKKVFVYHFMLAGTFEESIHNRAVFKQQLAQRVVDKKNPMSWSLRSSELVHHVKTSAKKDITDLIGKDHILDRLIAFRSDDQPDQQLITSIVSTDTFEEEDPTNTLTEVEKQEAEQMITMNRMRIQDPRKYELMRGVQQVQGLANVHGRPSTTPSTAMAPAPSSTAPGLSAPANPSANPYFPSLSQPPQDPASIGPVSRSMDGAYDGYDSRMQQSATQIPGLQMYHQEPRYHHQVYNDSGTFEDEVIFRFPTLEVLF